MLTEREEPSRYEMEGRPWKRGIVSSCHPEPPEPNRDTINLTEGGIVAPKRI
jgi:hypothetical protein